MEMILRGSRRPFVLIAVSFFMTYVCGMLANRAFRVQLFKVFRLPVEPKTMMVLMAFTVIITSS